MTEGERNSVPLYGPTCLWLGKNSLKKNCCNSNIVAQWCQIRRLVIGINFIRVVTFSMFDILKSLMSKVMINLAFNTLFSCFFI